MQWLSKPGELSPKQEYDSSHFTFRDTPSSHCEARRFFWRQWQILRPGLYSFCMQCSHCSHLIRLTSASPPCTECAPQNLGELIIPQLILSWHPEPPICFSLWFLYFLFPLQIKKVLFFYSQTTITRVPMLPMENSDYHFFFVIRLF